MALKRERGSNKSKGLCKLAIDQDMTIYAVDELKHGLSQAIEDYQRFELNLAYVEEIDSAGVQLLLAFRNELIQQKKEFKLTAVSGAVAKLIKIYGIDDRFDVGAVA